MEEMAAWTPDEALAAVRREMPPEWSLDCGYMQEGDGYYARLLDSEGEQKWFDENEDPKLLLLNLVGWLVYRGQTPDHPVWRRRGEVDPNRTHAAPMKPPPRAPDPIPEDLDPAAVEAFYEKMRDDRD